MFAELGSRTTPTVIQSYNNREAAMKQKTPAKDQKVEILRVPSISRLMW